ncbi:hypothetical protein BDK51DRAFT_46613 [Blyttiomyces helicus]|uniref:Uncharacterized protein n=1 Tax=Blyttiomyces helicus TaxID=388810 RepID=A0A4P9W3B6_9FUNG|nr:hypothetical protein BDK51DRAFT_46613 [Blyttiomyces helicus]|eukprot:RKO86801.1 hypothetical protein BDK51DRAFT_46613 [Blyttiomyces helicus]
MSVLHMDGNSGGYLLDEQSDGIYIAEMEKILANTNVWLAGMQLSHQSDTVQFMVPPAAPYIMPAAPYTSPAPTLPNPVMALNLATPVQARTSSAPTNNCNTNPAANAMRKSLFIGEGSEVYDSLLGKAPQDRKGAHSTTTFDACLESVGELLARGYIPRVTDQAKLTGTPRKALLSHLDIPSKPLVSWGSLAAFLPRPFSPVDSINRALCTVPSLKQTGTAVKNLLRCEFPPPAYVLPQT